MEHKDAAPPGSSALSRDETIRLIPAKNVRVLNPRTRNRKIFAQLVENIATLGLKRPVTVAYGGEDENGAWYELLCGQGRFEALQALGETIIPCCVVEAERGERFLISLAENIARRKHSNEDLLRGIRTLDERGYTPQQIANKTNLDPGYVYGILHLLKHGEQRLVAAVEKQVMPMNLALQISRDPGEDVQAAILELYESGSLKGYQLMRVRRIINKRDAHGKRYLPGNSTPTDKATPKKLLKTYQSEVRRQKVMIQKANIQEQRLLLITSALKRILVDEHFRTLLRAEGILDIPKAIADRLPQELLP
jgi:ParB family chromosome partitioning protein